MLLAHTRELNRELDEEVYRDHVDQIVLVIIGAIESYLETKIIQPTSFHSSQIVQGLDHQWKYVPPAG